MSHILRCSDDFDKFMDYLESEAPKFYSSRQQSLLLMYKRCLRFIALAPEFVDVSSVPLPSNLCISAPITSEVPSIQPSEMSIQKQKSYAYKRYTSALLHADTSQVFDEAAVMCLSLLERWWMKKMPAYSNQRGYKLENVPNFIFMIVLTFSHEYQEFNHRQYLLKFDNWLDSPVSEDEKFYSLPPFVWAISKLEDKSSYVTTVGYDIWEVMKRQIFPELFADQKLAWRLDPDAFHAYIGKGPAELRAQLFRHYSNHWGVKEDVV